MPPHAQTESSQEYLETILRLATEKPGSWIPNADIARALGIKAPSVTEMLEKLQNQGLITWEKRRGVQLTTDGTRIAQAMLDAHRLLEAFMTEVLELDDEDVKHRIACLLEHHLVSEPKLVEAMQRSIEKARGS